MKMICICCLRLDGGSRRRKERCLGARHRLSSIKLRIQNINCRVFKDRAHGNIRKDTHYGRNSKTLACSGLKKCFFRHLIIAFGSRCLGKRRQSLRIVMLLTQNICFGQQILIIGAVIRNSANCCKLSLGSGSVSKGQVVIGQSNPHFHVRRPRSLGAFQIRLRKRVVMHRP